MSKLGSRLRQTGTTSFLACALSLFSPCAPAQSAEDKAAADALFDAAREAMEAEDYEAACAKFGDSQRLDPGVGTLLNLGRCYDLSGKTSSAYSTYREAAALARAQGQVEREQLARKEVDRLEKLLTRIVIVVETGAVEGLTIKKAGKEIPRTMWGVPLPVDPGVQVLEVTAPGYQQETVTVEASGAGETVNVPVPPLQPLAGAAAEAPEERPEEASEASSPPQETAPARDDSSPKDQATGGPGAGPWILAGVGLAAVGVGTTFALLGTGENDKALGICQDVAVCPGDQISDWWDARNAAEMDYTIAYIGWGVGAAALIGGGIWLLTGSKRSHAQNLTLMPIASERGAGLIARGRF